LTISDQQAEWFSTTFDELTQHMEQAVLGKRHVVRLALTCLLSEGHMLLEDYPGTGKTMLARSLDNTVQGSHARIQFTPDLLPSDVVGVTVYDQHKGSFEFHPGPIFHSIVLADEINRASPKTQSALLEAMQERTVTVDGATYPLPKPFFVLATQNPVEQAGTFPLPEAQLDRFLFKLSLGYPGRMAEMDVLLANQQVEAIDDLGPVIDTAGVVELMQWSAAVAVSEAVMLYIIDLTQATRSDPSVAVGASPRASLALMRASRVRAASQGRDDVLPDDVKSLAMPVLAHRMILTADALLREEQVEQVTQRIIDRVKVPTGLGEKGRDTVGDPAAALEAAVS
jgi:MoxR-like ATPase